MALSRINTNQIVDGAVATADIADGLITTAKLADNAVTTAKTTDANITTAKLADNAVTTAKVTDGNITTAKVADDAVTQAKIGADAVGTTELANDVVINTSGAITTTGAFTSVGIDDNADANAITIDSSERVGIANTSPLLKLDVTGSNTAPASSGTSQSGSLRLGQSAGNGVVDMGFDTINTQGWIQATNKANLATNYKLTLNPNSGDVEIGNGNLVIGTAGKGIDFTASTDSTNTGSSATSELLDDYEEGTFSVAEQNGAGVSVTLSQAQYTRIGRMVFFYVDLAISSNSASGVVNFQSLPFTPSSNKSQKFDTFSNATNNPITFAIGNAIATVKGNATANLFYSDLSGKFLRINGQYQLD